MREQTLSWDSDDEHINDDIKKLYGQEGVSVQSASTVGGTTYVTFSLDDDVDEIEKPDHRPANRRRGPSGPSLSYRHHGHIVVPYGVSAIASGEYEGCAIDSIKLPETVEVIGDSAFRGCSSLREVVLPESVREIGKAAFSGCKGLESIALGGRVQSIGKGAFSGCRSLREITVAGEEVKSLEDLLTPADGQPRAVDVDVFEGCDALDPGPRGAIQRAIDERERLAREEAEERERRAAADRRQKTLLKVVGIVAAIVIGLLFWRQIGLVLGILIILALIIL